MQLRALLSLISRSAKDNGLSTPFICGGAPRDKLLGRISQIADLDITTGNDDVHQLAKIIAKSIPNAGFKIHEDGHASVMLGNLKVDFSSNFRVPQIGALLYGAGIKNASDMQRELYSRDFTCNALLMTMDLKTIQDPTGLGLQDLKLKRVRTCLPAKITLGMQHKRIVRVLYVAAKLGFEVDSEIVQWVRGNPSLIADCKPKYLATKLRESLALDHARTIRLIDEMNLSAHLPALPELYRATQGIR